jgi:hypothetical protein
MRTAGLVFYTGRSHTAVTEQSGPTTCLPLELSGGGGGVRAQLWLDHLDPRV